MDVTEDHRPQSLKREEQAAKRPMIDQVHRVHHRMTDGHRWMVQRHHQGHRITSDLLKAFGQPLQLTSPQATGGMTAPMAVEHKQTHTAHDQLSRRGGAEPTQDRIEEQIPVQKRWFHAPASFKVSCSGIAGSVGPTGFDDRH